MRFTRKGQNEYDDAIEWYALASPDTASRWVNGFENALRSLDFMPTRHPIAPEADYFGHTVRRLLYQPFRVLFYVTEAENEAVASVVILSVRHGSALPLGSNEEN